MAHLDSIIIHNFKSFKHVNIKFNNGFNCIVGANGSGKSNICDSLLFALGESSLKRMRVTNTAQLINSFAKPKKDDGVKRAYVKINFSGNSPMEVTRIIKSNNKISYRLDGRHTTRQEVVDALRSQKADINETNIIAQNEISYMINLNPKERRELIDVAAGIKEFNDKKTTAMKELEKVEIKMNESLIALNERKGFLSQLEKEKKDAEKYIQLTDTVKRISYTLLKNSERHAEANFKSISEAMDGAEQMKKALSDSITELSLMLEKLSSDKESLAKLLAERSIELGNANKVLEEINRNTAVKETQMKSLKEKMGELDLQVKQLKDEQKKLKDGSTEETSKLDAARKELEEKGKQLAAKESAEMEGSAQIDKLNQNQKKIENLYASSESLSKQYLGYKFEIEETDKYIRENEKLINSKSLEYDKLTKDLKQQKEIQQDAESTMSEVAERIRSMEEQARTYQKEMDNTYMESVDLREKLSSMGRTSDKTRDLLKQGIRTGFYGRAYDLCKYNDEYALAVNAAAASRLNYFVVESAETADRAIKLLKSRQIGRATFIPLKDIASKGKGDNPKLDRLIDHVDFDPQFERAFSYIFANTYVVESIAKAKAIGFGKGRFVTLDGELVEQSGIITGGSTKMLLPPSVLESKLKQLDDRRFATSNALKELNHDLENTRKEFVTNQVEATNCKVEAKHIEAAVSTLKSELDSTKAKSSDLKLKLDKINKAYSEIESKRDSVLEELNALKGENDRIYAYSNPNRKNATKKDSTELEALKSLRSEVEQLRISIATMSKEQELNGTRQLEISEQLKARSNETKDTTKRMAILDNELAELGKSLKDLNGKMGKSDASSRELYKKVQGLDAKIAKLGNERGKYQAELEKAGRDSIEQETRKVQLQTRITDIKAELMSYSNVQEVLDLTPEELEAKRTIAKNDIERLGAVNLKAPEVYELKKKDVDEANSRISVLANEKNSIIAMINEIESKKLNIFNDTLSDVNTNFQKLYNYIFDGSASLQLENPKDPFNSGLAVNIKSPKNKNSTVETLSGGEKALVIIMLIFALQAHNPMSLYIFDEIDASLDKENSKKLSKLMREMSRKSQLVVISHNDSLITAADTAIGVVHRNGESRAVGLQITPTSIEAK